MRAFIIDKPGKFTYIDRKKPHPSDTDVLIKVYRLGLCGSDLATFRGLNPLAGYPRIIGHEVSGIIEESGKDVPLHIKPGMIVTLIPYLNCGWCSSCLTGRINACKYNQTLGIQCEGASCEYIIIPWQKIIISDDLSFDELVLVEPLSVGFHAIRRARVKENDTVAVFGTGMVGLGSIIGAAAKTSKVVAIDIADVKLALAQEAGAKFVINSSTMNLRDKLDVITNGHGPDVIIEAVGLPQTFRRSVELVSFAGRVVYIGYVKEEVAYETRHFVMKELDIMGSRNADREDFIAVIDAVRNKICDTKHLITKKVSFNEMGRALKEWSDDPASITKIVVEMEA
ncbi:MAG: zinc-binding alcohol dehydrogenase family protein [Bacteroidales bacterium]|nr:MAG: zinc-binding alcohol dehydrogenase family protein [Bacteroidales bacterium]